MKTFINHESVDVAEETAELLMAVYKFNRVVNLEVRLEVRKPQGRQEMVVVDLPHVPPLVITSEKP